MLRRDDGEHEVPSDWREPFRQIIDAFLMGDFQLSDHPIDRVQPISPATADAIVKNINTYGAAMSALSAATWERSVYRWMDDYWLFLVDLTINDEEVSDLTLHARLHDTSDARLEIQSVHVP
ncbi:MAG: hypothetical protein QM605_09115 [Sphingobium sp.]